MPTSAGCHSKARIFEASSGLTELDALAHRREETGRERQAGPSGIGARPTRTWLRESLHRLYVSAIKIGKILR